MFCMLLFTLSVTHLIFFVVLRFSCHLHIYTHATCERITGNDYWDVVSMGTERACPGWIYLQIHLLIICVWHKKAKKKKRKAEEEKESVVPHSESATGTLCHFTWHVYVCVCATVCVVVRNSEKHNRIKALLHSARDKFVLLNTSYMY